MTDETTPAADAVTTSVGGATVKITPQPEGGTASQDIKAAASNERMITDELGHAIKLKRPSPDNSQVGGASGLRI